MSVYSLSFHPAALDEAVSAANWYRDRSPLAATRFVTELNQAIDRILEAPHRWPRSPRGTRKLKLPCFPFLVIYREAAESVLILAVAHGHRRPGYWKNRV
jgi:plasmid stabilization system protein ParE